MRTYKGAILIFVGIFAFASIAVVYEAEFPLFFEDVIAFIERTIAQL